MNAAAVRVAVAAAEAAEVEVRAVRAPPELNVLQSVMEAVWGMEIVPPRNLLRGLSLAGSTLLVAWRDDQPIGFALGWMGWESGLHFHSHQTGVVLIERSGGVGYALKLAQRAACLEHGITEMRWTVDPLLATNAIFNMHRLGAHVVDFIPDCYGERTDAFNTGDVTDRVKVSWRLDDIVGSVRLEPAADSPRLIVHDPVPSRSSYLPSIGALIPIPKRYHQLRQDEPSLADAWRRAVGSALADTFAAGLGIAGLAEGAYVVGAVGRQATQAEHSP